MKRSLFDGVDHRVAEANGLGAQAVAIKLHLSWQFTVLKDMASTLDITTKEVARLNAHVRNLSLSINWQIREV